MKFFKNLLLLLQERNDSNHIINLFKFENEFTHSWLEVSKLRRKLRRDIKSKKLSKKNKEELKDQCQINEIIYYNNVEKFCFYLLHFSDNKILYEKFKRKYKSHLKELYDIERTNFIKDGFEDKYPFIVELFTDWCIWTIYSRLGGIGYK